MPKVKKVETNGHAINNIAPALAALAVDVGKLRLDPKNARLHPERSIAGIKDSLAAFGQTKPLVVRKDTMMVVAGNGTLTAAKSLGWTKVAANVMDMDDATAAAYGLADNRTAELSGWDHETVAALESLIAESGQAMIGWTSDELVAMRAKAFKPQADPDAIPDVPAIPVSKRGDLWLLGGHRLVCGDAREPETVAMAMDGRQASLMFTDPPYGVSIGKKNRMLNGVQRAGRRLENIEDDDLSPDALEAELLKAFKVAYTHLADNCSIFVCSPQGGELCMMMMMMKKAGIAAKHVIVWKKSSPTFSMNRLDYDYCHEPILFTWKKTHKKTKREGPYKSSVWEVPRPSASPEHATTKPIGLPLNAIMNHTDVSDIVLDIYNGSGTTMIAAHQCGRNSVGVEIDPRSIDVCLQRWATFTGLDPVREDGVKFSELKQKSLRE